MITNKHIAVITAVFLCLSLITCGFIVYAANTWETKKIPEYQNKLFGDEIITIDIKVDTDDWRSLTDNAQAKEWISGDLIINGNQISTVGIRTKGNSSLSQTKDDKYSLQFKFNKYVKGQSYYGLDSLCINNMLGDATYMKDYISYDIMKFIGVDTPLINYAKVTVNGEDYGFCIALERYDEAFLDRVYNSTAGELYNVKGTMGNRENIENPKLDIDNDLPDFTKGAGMGFRGGNSSGGGSLLYIDDNYDSYSSIFDNALSKISDNDKNRVITAIKNLNSGTNLEKYFDVDEILRYFAAHTILVNLDSYVSNMQQNYYIYEKHGKISILPWDYGLAFGGFQSGDASSVINFPIDTPVSGVNMEDRPLLDKLLEVEEYKEKYHLYLKEIVEGYFKSGSFESTINNLDEKINEYVKSNNSPYYTYQQYKDSLPELIKIGTLRAESVKAQLEGAIPATSEGQSASKSSLIDSSGVNLAALGSIMGGGSMGKGEKPVNGNIGQGNFTPPNGNAGQGNFTPPNGNIGQGKGQDGFNFPKGNGNQERPNMPPNGNENMQKGMNPNINGMNNIQTAINPASIIILVVSALLLIVAIIFVAKPKKDVI
jgi:spore coat protein CotH